MAFNLQSWGRLSSNANSVITVLQDGSISGSPSSFSYIHATDDINTISSDNYFGSQCFELDQTDLIYVAASDGIVQLYVVSVDEINKSVITALFSEAGGDVSGPGSSTNHAIARYAGTTGKIIANSGVVIDDTNNITGVQNLQTNNGIDSFNGKGINLWGNGNTWKTTLKSTANVEDVEIDLPSDYPIQDGMQLTGNRDGTTYWGLPVGTQWLTVTSDTTLTSNTGYTSNSGSLINLTLPTGPVKGDLIEIRGLGTGGFKIKQNANDKILLGNTTTALGTSGYIQSNSAGDAVYLACIATSPNNVWSCIFTGQISNSGTVTNTPGNLTIPIPINVGGTNMSSATAYGTVYAGTGGSALTTSSPGVSGQVWTSNGAGSAPTFQDQTGGGMTFSFVTSGPVTMVQNVAYVANSSSGVITFNLPATCAPGQVFGVRGMGTGGWKLQANTGQTIHFNSTDTSSGGYLASNARYDYAIVFCSVANTEYIVWDGGGAAITVA